MTEKWLRVLLALITANSLPPNICAPSDDTFSSTLRSGSRTHVKEEDGLTIFFRLARVVIDHVTDFLSLAVDVARDVPIVSVEWGFSPDGKC